MNRNNFIVIASLFFCAYTFNVFAQDSSSEQQAFQALQLIDQGQVKEGMVLLNQFIQSYPDQPSWRLNYANLLHRQGMRLLRQGDVGEANSLLSQARDHLLITTEQFNKVGDKILLSEAYFVLGEIERYTSDDMVKAEEYYQQAVKLYNHSRAQKELENLSR